MLALLDSPLVCCKLIGLCVQRGRGRERRNVGHAVFKTRIMIRITNLSLDYPFGYESC